MLVLIILEQNSLIHLGVHVLQACSLIFWNDSLHYGNVLEEIGIEGYEKMSTSAPFLVVMIFFRCDMFRTIFCQFHILSNIWCEMIITQ